MAKRDKVLSEESVVGESSTATHPSESTPPDNVAPEVSPEMAALYARIEAQEKRLAAAEADKARAEARAAEAAERIRLMAKAQAARPSTTLTSAVLEDQPSPRADVKENGRKKVHASQVRKAQGDDLGEVRRTIICHHLRGSERSEVQVTLPDHVRASSGYDAFVVVFFGSVARVPQVVAEILCTDQPRRYQLAN